MELPISIVIAVCLALVIEARPNLNEWTKYKKDFGKEYPDRHEDGMRMSIYLKNKKLIEEFNLKQSAELGFQLGINHLSDWTYDELENTNGIHFGENSKRKQRDVRRHIDNNLIKGPPNPAPRELDWRKTPGRVTSVKNQGNCSSDWTFSAVGVIEGQLYHYGPLVSLSAQNLLDCNELSYDCSGGDAYEGLITAEDEVGIEADSDYPYVGYKQKCKFEWRRSVIRTDGPEILRANDERYLKHWMAQYGPVSVTINVGPDDLMAFTHYKSGVYRSKTCKNNENSLNRGLLVVGYGTDPKEGDFWIVKNSLSDKWGENGYMRLARNSNNMCGIATFPIIAVFQYE